MMNIPTDKRCSVLLTDAVLVSYFAILLMHLEYMHPRIQPFLTPGPCHGKDLFLFSIVTRYNIFSDSAEAGKKNDVP